MNRLPEGVSILATHASVAASAEVSMGQIICNNLRTVTITVRVTYGGGAGTAGTMRLYYSPDGIHTDTVPYTNFSVNLSAGATVQETAILDLPERGFIEFRFLNGDAVSTNVRGWYSVARQGDTSVEGDKVVKILEEIDRKMLRMNVELEAIKSLTA